MGSQSSGVPNNEEGKGIGKGSDHKKDEDKLIRPSKEDLEYRIAFDIFDADGSGTISRKEYISVLRSLGLRVNEQVLKNDGFTAGDDTDAKSCADFTERMKKKLSKPTKREQMMQAFLVFRHDDTCDEDDNQLYVDREELEYAVSNLGEPLTAEELVLFKNELNNLELNSGRKDVNGHEMVNVEHLVNALTS